MAGLQDSRATVRERGVRVLGLPDGLDGVPALQNDNYAHGAFTSATGEMFSQPLNWELVAGNILQ